MDMTYVEAKRFIFVSVCERSLETYSDTDLIKKFVSVWKNTLVTSNGYSVRSLVQWLKSRTVTDVRNRD